MHTSCRASSEVPAFPSRVAISTVWGQAAYAGANPPLFQACHPLVHRGRNCESVVRDPPAQAGQVFADAILSKRDRLSSMVLPCDSAQVYL